MAEEMPTALEGGERHRDEECELEVASVDASAAGDETISDAEVFGCWIIAYGCLLTTLPPGLSLTGAVNIFTVRYYCPEAARVSTLLHRQRSKGAWNRE